MLRRRTLIAFGSGLVLSLGSLIAQGASNQPTMAQQLDQAAAQANGTQAGTIQQNSNGTLTISPFNSASNMKQFQINNSVPVFQGNGKVTTKALMPGVAVRVHYINEANANPAAAAIEILNKQDEQAARTQAQSSPPVMLGQAAPQTTSPSQTGPTLARPVPIQPGAPAAIQVPMNQAVAQASGSQPGKIDKIAAGTLMLRPYQKAAGEASLQFDPNQVPVYQDNANVSWTSLQPGSDVRVYYKNEGSHQKPKVVAVEILTTDQAKQLEKSERNIPRGK